MSAPSIALTCDLKQWSLDDKVGQLVWIGVKNLNDIKKYKPSGVILFKWNYKNLSQIKKFNSDLADLAKKHLKAPLFIGIDHEGGKIDRLGSSLTPFPDAASMGSVRNSELVFEAGQVMGKELALLGINTNLAPVLDLGDARTFLGNRIWGQEPQEVANSTKRFIQGLKSAGIFPVAKHFPGHGGSRTDAHFKMPVIGKSFERLWNEDLRPFADAIKDDLPALMTAHVEVSSVDRGPASLSEKFLTDVLRGRLGFKGLVVTDDLEMGGVFSEAGGLVEDAALKAFKSGTDQLLVVWSDVSKRKILSKLKVSIESGAIDPKALDEKICRILAAKDVWLKEKDEIQDWQKEIRKPASIQLAKDISKQALIWVAGPKDKIVEKLNLDWKKSWRVAVGYGGEGRYWKKVRPQDQVFVLPRRPDEKMKADLLGFLNGASKNQMRIVLTGPRNAMGDESYKVFLDWITQKSLAEKASQPGILWIHEGLNPVHVKSAEKSHKMPLGIVSLNGGMTLNLEAFFEWVRELDSSAPEKVALAQ